MECAPALPALSLSNITINRGERTEEAQKREGVAHDVVEREGVYHKKALRVCLAGKPEAQPIQVADLEEAEETCV